MAPSRLGLRCASTRGELPPHMGETRVGGEEGKTRGARDPPPPTRRGRRHACTVHGEETTADAAHQSLSSSVPFKGVHEFRSPPSH